ncbi:MAG: NifU family protein [Bacteroidia bacterium]
MCYGELITRRRRASFGGHQADGGDVELVSISDEDDVTLRLVGACSTCSMSDMTMTAGIEESLRRSFPGLGKITALKNA